MSPKHYQQYLQSITWKVKRQARLSLDQHRCRLCDQAEDLEVHHRPSSYNRIPHETAEDDLTTLCRTCHCLVTSRIRGRRYQQRVLPVLESIVPQPRSRKVPRVSISPDPDLQDHKRLRPASPQRAAS